VMLACYPCCSDVRLITCTQCLETDLELSPAAQSKKELPDTCSTSLTLPANAKRH